VEANGRPEAHGLVRLVLNIRTCITKTHCMPIV
jgi:hypothetical protein